MFTTLIEPSRLAAHLDDPDWVIIDCRFDLARTEWGHEAWAAGHIPGAQYAHLDLDLSGPRSPGTGRHPLPEPTALAAALGRMGIDQRVQVVGYDQGNGAFAARLWWLLRWLGHRAVAVLDGGLAGWRAAGLPLETTTRQRPARHFDAHPDSSLVVSTAEIARLQQRAALGREALLVDARPPDRFAGRNETLDPVAGHIPGASNRPVASNHDSEARFLAAPVLQAQWRELLDGRSPQQLIAMCGSGVTACHNLLAMAAAGLDGARLYAGSWSEWITDPARPVATGDGQGDTVS